MTFGSLFAGIGGFDLGFERAGMRCVWQVEIDPYCRKVLSKHWPDVPKWDDVKTFTGEGFERPDVICGGFPCQDISNAGRRAGINGKRSGLWSEYARIICLVRPQFVVVENVAALLNFGMERVLGDLAESGYDAEWDCLPASAFGAPHRRDRVWIVANSKSDGWKRSGKQHERRNNHSESKKRFWPEPSGDSSSHESETVANAKSGKPRESPQRERRENTVRGSTYRRRDKGKGQELSHSVFAGLEGHECSVLALAEFRRHNTDPAGPGWWAVEPELGRVANGVPNRVDRLKGLGNAVVPQVAEWIGRRLMQSFTEVSS